MFLYKSATGVEKSVLPTLVTKHGSHNQQSHAGSRGRGGMGAGATSSKPSTSGQYSDSADKTRSSISRKLESEVMDFQDTADSLSAKALGTQDKKSFEAFDRASNQLSAARKDFTAAAGLKGREQQGKLQSGVDKIEAAINNISNSDFDGAEELAQGMYESMSRVFINPDRTLDALGIEVDMLLRY